MISFTELFLYQYEIQLNMNYSIKCEHLDSLALRKLLLQNNFLFLKILKEKFRLQEQAKNLTQSVISHTKNYIF